MALMNRFANWLLTETGKKFSFYAATAASSGILLAHTLPHTFFLDKYVEIVHLYKHGFSVPLTDELKQRFEKTLDLLEVDKRDRHLYKPFAAYGFDIFSAGSSYSKYGVRVGLPANFFYYDKSAVDKSSIKIRDESIVWELDEGKLFLESLVLSEKAQIYAMAREIKFRDTIKPFLDAVVATVSVAGCYGLANSLNTKFNLYSKPRGMRVFMYCLVGVFSFGSYALCKDASQVYFESKIDQELKKKNWIFAEGGKEFYNKLIGRNIALRKLLGKEGERVFSVLGNENYFVRYKHIPVVQRKLFFEQEMSQ